MRPLVIALSLTLLASCSLLKTTPFSNEPHEKERPITTTDTSDGLEKLNKDNRNAANNVTKKTAQAPDFNKVKESSPVATVNMKHLEVVYQRPWISSEEDVEEYLDSLRTRLLKEIANGKKVQV